MAPMVQQLLSRGIGLHQAGDLARAAELYQQVLVIEPQHADALRLLGVVAYQAGHHATAAELLGQAIAINSTIAEYHSNLGLALLAMGDADRAAAAQRRAIALKPELLEGHYNLGAALRVLGKLEDAEAAYRRAIELSPRYAEAHNNLGNVLRALGRKEEAIEAYRRAIALRPDNAEAHNNLGNVLKDQGKGEEAIKAYREAIRIQPGMADAHYNLGNALQGEKDLDGALMEYREALRLNSGDVRIHVNLGIALQEMGRSEEAERAYLGAIAVDAEYPEAHFNLGNLLQARGRNEEAVRSYERAIALRPTYAEAFNNLGNVLKEMGRSEDALEAYGRAISIRGDFAEAYNNRGNLLNSKGRADDAVASYRRAIDLRPEYAEAYNNLGGALKEQGLLEEALDSFRRARELKPGIPEFGSNLVYTMHFHPKYGAKEIAAEHRAWNERHARPLARLIRPHENPRDPERPLRVGMISPDFRNHPIGRFLLPYFAAHDGERYPLFCYSDVVREDELTARLKGHAQQWRSTVGKNHAQVAAMIREDRIDILLDLTMHMQGSRLLVFAQKPAPVQATYLAYCSSTGLETMDYRLTDGHFDPEDLEGIYTERSVRLRSYWCYEASPEAPEVGPLPATQRGYVTFGCLNNFCKVTDPVVTAWARLLRAVPESRLLLHAAPGWHRDVLQRRFTTHAVDGARIDFAGMLPMAEYFELYQGIDIALDPWPYAGGTTTCDGLWMGVPVVTLAGTTGVGRGGVSILKTLGMDELVARDADEYVEVAEALARNGGRMERLRTGLRERMRGSVLMDGQAFARDFETALRKMWREWCRP